MEQYIDVTSSVVFAGFVGLIAPFVFPFIFKLLGKWAKRELSDQEKRILIVLISFLVSVGIVAADFNWEGEFGERAWAFIMYLALNFTTLRGVIQSVYELIIKNFPSIEKRIAKIENIK